MGAPYSDDLRKKALEALGRGEKPSALARLLGISRNTLHQWRQRQAATGDWGAKRGYQKGHSPKITDWEEFRSFVDAHAGQPMAAMAALRGVGRTTIERGLKKIGYSRKKRATATENGTQRNGRSLGNRSVPWMPPN